jgi:sugar phosphate isomerase/epimerase
MNTDLIRTIRVYPCPFSKSSPTCRLDQGVMTMQLAALNDPRRNLLQEIEWVATQGFDLLDLTLEAPGAALESTDWPTVRAALATHRLAVICRAAPDLPIEHASPLVRQAALDELRRSIDAAALLGAKLCTTRFCGWPAYLNEAAGYEYYRQLYTILLAHGGAQGVAVALENRAQNPHQLKWFREIFHRLPELKLCYNVAHGNVQTVQSMTREYLFALADRLVHVRISDNDGSASTQLPFGAPATGGLDLHRELQSLRSFRYDGSITVEVAGDRRWLLASAEMLRAAWPHAQ